MIYYHNKLTGQKAYNVRGVSFTTLFFGPLPMLFRGHIDLFILHTIFAICTLGLSNVFLFFSVNRIVAYKLRNNGFTPVDNRKAQKVRASRERAEERNAKIMGMLPRIEDEKLAEKVILVVMALATVLIVTAMHI